MRYNFLLGVFTEAMSRIISILSAIWATSLLVITWSVEAYQPETTSSCEGKYKDGSRPTPEEFKKILEDHQAWLLEYMPQGAVKFRDDWSVEIPTQAVSDSRRVNLCRAYLSLVDLQKTRLAGASLQEAVLIRASLQEAWLNGTNLQGADLYEANLQQASLIGANLQRAELFGANFHSAILAGTNLQGASLQRANLQRATLQYANLKEANLKEADLQEADLSFTDLAFAIFEPRPGSLPYIPSLATAQNLWQMTFRNSPHALASLREALKDAGMRQQEREVTFAIKHTERLRAWKRGGLVGKVESALTYILFELTCDWGMSPLKPLGLLALLVGIFSIPYMVAVYKSDGKAGIWAVWPSDRVHKDEGREEPERITPDFLFPRLQPAQRWQKSLIRGMRIPLTALYFSVLSALRIGWQDLTLGSWIVRMQPREYILRATGWVRFVSGFQSLVSVYLLALWLLTYFGRLFE